MTPNTTDPIASALGVTPMQGEIIIPEPVSKKETEAYENDLDYARTNIMQIVEHGHNMLEDLIQIAQQAQNAKVFEVATMHMKNLTAMNMDLIELHIKRKILAGKKIDAPLEPTNVTNNLIVTTHELLQALKKGEKTNGTER